MRGGRDWEIIFLFFWGLEIFLTFGIGGGGFGFIFPKRTFVGGPERFFLEVYILGVLFKGGGRGVRGFSPQFFGCREGGL